MYGLQFGFALMPNTNTSNSDVIDLSKYVGFELSFTHGDLIAMSTFILSLQYNVGNFYYGWIEAKDKMHALFCMLPFF